uniref:Uncharacterized protein n=1 Tax=Oryza meridionalis TaxID=40149 RepID=A0A0E0EWK3_9ORYZ
MEAVVRLCGWRGLPCRHRGGRRRVAVVEASVVWQREGVMETGGGVESRPVTWSSRAVTAGAGSCRLQRWTACGGGGEDGDDEVAGRSAAAAAVAVTAVTGGMAASDG